MQLDLFPEPIELKQDRKIQELEERYDRLRKSQHARITNLQKELKEVKNKLEFLESHICKERLFCS